MAKAVKVLCDRCENKIVAGVSFCDHCSYPTRWATHEERTNWEVHQWKIADRSHAPRADAKQRNGRRWNPFGRKQEAKPTLTLVSAPAPAKAIAAEPVRDITIELDAPAAGGEHASLTVPTQVAQVASVAAPAKPAARPERTVSRPKPVERARPEAAPAKPEPVAKAQPARAPAPKLARGTIDDEPVTDTPATIMAMRLLNARVKELDERIQKLEAELDPSRRAT